jgi:hypothetical protein
VLACFATSSRSLPPQLRRQRARRRGDPLPWSAMRTGIRIVRALFATPRCTAWRIHHVA